MAVKFNEGRFDGMHQVYLARGLDRGGNRYADPFRAYPDVMARRGLSARYKNSHGVFTLAFRKPAFHDAAGTVRKGRMMTRDRTQEKPALSERH